MQANVTGPQEGQTGQTRHHRIQESIAVAILAVASLASAWCGYQANSWNGTQAESYERSSQLRVEAVRAENRDSEEFAVDVAIYTNFLNAEATGNEELADRYRASFRPELAAAYDAWLALPGAQASGTPFDLPEYRDSEDDAAAEAARQAGEQEFRSGLQAAEFSDQYTLVAVALAGVLFLAGIVSSIVWGPARIAVLVVAAFGLASALLWMLRIAPS